MGEFKAEQLDFNAGALCPNPDCMSIISKLTAIVRERMRKERDWGLNDAYVAAKYGLLDDAECKAKARSFGIKDETFELLWRHSAPTLLKRTAFIWKELRRLVLERDGRCKSCNKPPDQVHHITWLTRGGHPLDPCNMRSLCSNCHGDQNRCNRPTKTVSPLSKTILSTGEAVNSRLSVVLGSESSDLPQLGHRPTKNELMNHWTKIRDILFDMLGTWKRVNMVMEGLRLQATQGKCYASARYLASAGLANKKTWDRVSLLLRSQALISTARLMRPNRSLSTNLTDFSALWALLLKLLQREEPWHKTPAKLERLADGTVWLKKADGAWKSLEELLLQSLPPPEEYSQAPLL